VFPNLVAAEIIPHCPHYIPPRHHACLNERIARFLQPAT